MKPENPFESEHAAPLNEQKPIEQASEDADLTVAEVLADPLRHALRIRDAVAAPAPDAAVAVPLADLQALIKHALKTGGEDLAARFQL